MTVKCNSVTYVQKINAYRGHHAGSKRDFVYAVNKYGPMAEILATKSSIENIRYQHLIEEKDDYAIVKIYHAPTDTVFDILIDKDDIERVVLNILTNSIKYTKEGGEIKIYVGFVYNDAYIKVFDNGIGIPEEDLNRIFERFYRVDKARSREMGGTGLGLSIAKDLLDRNGGSIDIKSEVGKGTEVVIKVPTKAKQEKVN